MESHSARLSKVDLEILKLLWLDLYSGSGFGLTRAQILAALGRASDDLPALVNSDAALRAHLKALVAASPSLVVTSKAQTNAAGGRPWLYKFDRDATISWPTTAFLLIELWNFRGRAIERKVFIDQMLADGVKNSSTGLVATADELSRQIDTSSTWGYIGLINTSVLLPLERIQFEYDLLKFIAGHLT